MGRAKCERNTKLSKIIFSPCGELRGSGPRAKLIWPYSENESDLRKSSSPRKSSSFKAIRDKQNTRLWFHETPYQNMKLTAHAEVKALGRDQFGNKVEMH